ncbi:Ribose-5-phosphate isomerase A [Candidatus Hartigia pinicola]|nr:Ribose-5-phosphate isomerase A [Candidatus Hartigia pinicola]
MTYDILKKSVALAALDYIKSSTIIGIGTGSTVSYFIDELVTMKEQIEGVVSSSKISTAKLRLLGFTVFDCNEVDMLDVYVDGADEIDRHMNMIKGGGAALTCEKIIAAISKTFVCIIDQTKQVDVLGKFPLPVEVIPMARSYVARELIKLGGIPEYRQNVITDNNNIILDVHNLTIINPMAFENKINNIAGVVTVGLFANRSADIILMGTTEGIKVFKS